MNAHAYSDDAMARPVEASSAHSHAVADAVGETAARASQGAEAAQVALDAMNQVEESSQVLERRVEALTDASQRINAILSTIEAIASQTNLLALNATIEAARAGEAGRGFAVVAGEVKALAGQTAKATEDIAARIAALDTEVKEILDGVRGSGESVARGKEAVDQMTLATQDIAQQLNTLRETIGR
jgi:methyl-accepting chemotaxis protein